MPSLTTILAALMIWLFAGLIFGLALGSAIPRRNRDLEPGQGSADARRGGVDQVFHAEGNS